MGGNRRKKNSVNSSNGSTSNSTGSNHQHHRRLSSRSVLALRETPIATHCNGSCAASSSSSSTTTADNEFLLLEETITATSTDTKNGNSFYRMFHLREIWILAVILLLFAAVSILVGFAAGISISIQYYEKSDDDVALTSLYASSAGKVTLPAISIMQGSRNRHLIEDLAAPSDEQWTVLDESRTMMASGVSYVGDLLHSNSGAYENWLQDHHTTIPEHLERDSMVVRPPTMMDFEQHWMRMPPKACKDGKTLGYDSWNHLRTAIRDANRYSAERYRLWQEYFGAVARARGTEAASLSSTFVFDDDSMYYEEELVFTICPDSVLKSRRDGPLLLNTENMIIECANRNCVLDNDESHLSFGPDAKNVRIRGITFAHASSSSLAFYYDGADASFEDCTWIIDRRHRIDGINNGQQHLHSNWGAIADVNSTSTVNFFRCFMNQPRNPRETFASSLSIRQPLK